MEFRIWSVNTTLSSDHHHILQLNQNHLTSIRYVHSFTLFATSTITTTLSISPH